MSASLKRKKIRRLAAVGHNLDDSDVTFISLDDIARSGTSQHVSPLHVWMSQESTVLLLGTWESRMNPRFNRNAFAEILTEAKSKDFIQKPSDWIARTDAIGMRYYATIYGGTYAHVDIAMTFAMWVSAEYCLHIVRDYRRLGIHQTLDSEQDWNPLDGFVSDTRKTDAVVNDEDL